MAISIYKTEKHIFTKIDLHLLHTVLERIVRDINRSPQSENEADDCFWVEKNNNFSTTLPSRLHSNHSTPLPTTPLNHESQVTVQQWKKMTYSLNK